MKALTIADTHNINSTQLDKLKSLSPNQIDLILLLGDLGDKKIIEILERKFKNKNILGLLGNHDYQNYFKNTKVNNIHNKVVIINGKKIAGWGGSFKYKKGLPISFNQTESLNFAEQLPQADILISHTSPYQLYPKQNNQAHQGLKGIERYIHKHQLELNLHGHFHLRRKSIIKTGWIPFFRNECKVISVYGIALVDLKEKEIDYDF